MIQSAQYKFGKFGGKFGTPKKLGPETKGQIVDVPNSPCRRAATADSFGSVGRDHAFLRIDGAQFLDDVEAAVLCLGEVHGGPDTAPIA